MNFVWVGNALSDVIQTGEMSPILEDLNYAAIVQLSITAGFAIVDGVSYWFDNWGPAPTVIGGNVVIMWYPKDPGNGGGGPPPA